MIALLCFVLAILLAPFKSKGRLEAENAALRHQLIVLRRKKHGRVRLTNNDRLYLAVLLVSIGPEGPHNHPSRDADALASGRLSSVLALEVVLAWRAAADRHGTAGADPANQLR